MGGSFQEFLGLGLDPDGSGRPASASYWQHSLFAEGGPPRSLPRIQGRPQMGAEALNRWKDRIITFQTQVRQTPPPQQRSLLSDPEPSGFVETAKTRPELAIDPFALPPHPFEFYDLPDDPSPATPVLYFVIDRAADLILYIGEAVRARSRWAGPHDCKRYYRNYYTLHQELDLPHAVSISFWGDAFPDAKRRRQQERACIQRWRSPFNKENWRVWGTPFIDGKASGDR